MSELNPFSDSNHGLLDHAVQLLADAIYSSKPREELPPELQDKTVLEESLSALLEIRKFSAALADGDMTASLQQRGPLANALKSLQANLNHLTWQAQRIASGDFSQRVSFIGEFSEAFNSIVIRLQEARNELQKKEIMESQVFKQSEILRQSSYEINTASLEAERVCQAIYQAATQLIPCDTFVVARYDYASQQVIPIYQKSTTGNWRLRKASLNNCFLGYAIQKNQSFIIRDFDQFPPLEYQFEDCDKPKDTRSGLAVLMHLGGLITGALFTQSLQSNIYTDEHLQILEMLASQSAAALENARLYEEVHRLAISDSLTSLFTRRHFFSMAQIELERSRRYGFPLSLIMMDIDLFKQVNDTYGHLAGDRVLQTIAKTCKRHLRASDVIGRYGGEEFLILLPQTDLEGSRLLAERLRSKISRLRLATKDGKVKVTVSMGIHTVGAGKFPETPSLELIDQMIGKADAALYAAKQMGRNQVVIG